MVRYRILYLNQLEDDKNDLIKLERGKNYTLRIEIQDESINPEFYDVDFYYISEIEFKQLENYIDEIILSKRMIMDGKYKN